MVRRRDQLTRFGVVGLALAGSFALAALVAAPVGPLFLLPALAAAWWFGALGGLIAGVAASLLFVLAQAVNSGKEVPPLASIAARVAIFSGAGYLLGLVVSQRALLRGRVLRQRAELEELRILRDMLTPPRPPTRAGMELATCFIPSQHGVAGDFYLVADGPRGSTVLVIGDVSGKGPVAARRAGYVRTALATFAPFEDDPARLLGMANQALVERSPEGEDFVTAACVVLGASGTIAWSLAGHPPPLWLDSGASFRGPPPGLPLGISPQIGAATGSATLGRGSGMVLYSDGLLDARDPGGAPLGGDVVRRIIVSLSGAPAARVVDELRAAAEGAASGVAADDISILVVRRTA